jgi:hypothetical protein
MGHYRSLFHSCFVSSFGNSATRYCCAYKFVLSAWSWDYVSRTQLSLITACELHCEMER